MIRYLKIHNNFTFPHVCLWGITWLFIRREDSIDWKWRGLNGKKVFKARAADHVDVFYICSLLLSWFLGASKWILKVLNCFMIKFVECIFWKKCKGIKNFPFRTQNFVSFKGYDLCSWFFFSICYRLYDDLPEEFD